MKDINLRPYREEKEKKIKKSFNRSIIISAIISILACGALYENYSSSYNNYKKRSDYIKKELHNIKLYNKVNEDLKTERENGIKKINLSYSLYNGKFDTAKFLDKLVVVFPSNNGRLDSLIKQDNKIILNGVLDNKNILHQFLNNLSKNKMFSNYKVKQIIKNDNNINFKVVINEKRDD